MGSSQPPPVGFSRREFLLTSALAAAGAVTNRVPAAAQEVIGAGRIPAPAAAAAFQLDYAPHFGMFVHHAGEDPISQLRFMHESGFRSLEDNGMRERPVEEQERIGRELERLGMRMGVFVAHTISWGAPTLARGDAASRDQFLREIAGSVEVARRVGARWMTVVPGHADLRQDPGYQTAHLVESLRQASRILEPHGLVMVLEPLNWLTDHPGQFLTRIPQAFEICRAVDSPSCKILFDIYHQQITEGNLIPNLDRAWSEVAYIQIGDNPGRKEPTTGEINFANVFRHIHSKGYDGVLGMEHGNSRDGRAGEIAVIEAYRAVDPGDARA